MFTLDECKNSLRGTGRIIKDAAEIEKALSAKKRRDMDASVLEVGDVLVFSDPTQVKVFKDTVNGESEYYGFIVPILREGTKDLGMKLSFSIFDRVAFVSEKTGETNDNGVETWQRKVENGKPVIIRTTGTAVDAWKTGSTYFGAYQALLNAGKNIVVKSREAYTTQRPVKFNGKWVLSDTEVVTTYIHKFDFDD